MTQQSAPVSCAIECYPFEGTPYFISGGQIESVTTTKSLRSGADGKFKIALAPGGPDGAESVPVWTELITPGSHILIGMQRGGDAAIVMDGIATVTSEHQIWQTTPDHSTAVRSPDISGTDFAWFFNAQNWYSLSMWGLVTNSGLGDDLGLLPASLAATMSQGLIGNGSPVEVGKTWFNSVMAGSGGMMGSTFLPYKGGNTRLPFSTLMTQVMEQYPGAYIPLTEQFLGLESWMAKFMDIFPWPWYEFFVTTAPSGFYSSGLVTQPSGTAGFNYIASGRTFTMDAFPTAAPSGPQLVARVTPIPRISFNGSLSSGSYAATALDMTRWNALPKTTLTGVGVYESTVMFSSDEVKNFYMINPTAYQTLFGNNGANVVPFQFIFAGAADPASVHRYGYRPVDGTIRWLNDWEGLTSQKGTVDMIATVATLTGGLISWWHPLVLMARAEVAIPLSPSIYIGTRFEYAPFKDGILWTFYVETVTHRYEFGGHSMTTLELCRGLPSSIYKSNGAAGGLLQSIYTGNARREFVPGGSGIYQIGLPKGTGQGLQLFSTADNSAQIAGQMWSGFVTPQYPSS